MKSIEIINENINRAKITVSHFLNLFNISSTEHNKNKFVIKTQNKIKIIELNTLNHEN